MKLECLKIICLNTPLKCEIHLSTSPDSPDAPVPSMTQIWHKYTGLRNAL